jgi:hypothetical protein
MNNKNQIFMASEKLQVSWVDFAPLAMTHVTNLYSRP